jgi:hypothetical protein
VPAEADVMALAAKLRLELATRALAAAQALGPAPDRVSPIEHELRVHLHDALNSDHDRDFRSLACLPLDQLRDRTLVVLRVDYMGRLIVETVTGEDVLPGEPRYLWTVLHRGHMRLVQPPPEGDGTVGLQDVARSAGPCGDTPASGWKSFLEHQRSGAAAAPGEVSQSCGCCGASKAKTPAPPRLVAPAVPETTLAFAEKGSGDHYSVWHGRELILPAVGTSTARLIKARRQLAPLAEEPFELYEDPEQGSAGARTFQCPQGTRAGGSAEDYSRAREAGDENSAEEGALDAEERLQPAERRDCMPWACASP